MKTLKDIILNTDPDFFKGSLVHEFIHKTMPYKEALTSPVINAYIDGLLRQIRCSEEIPASPLCCVYVPQLRKGVIHDSLVFYPWDAVKEYEPIPAWDHLVPAAYPEDEIFCQDPEGINIMCLTEAEAELYLKYNTLPSQVEWTTEDLATILNTVVLNADTFTGPLIAVQALQQFMETLGFGASSNEDEDDFDDFYADFDEEPLDELYSQVAVYHTLQAITGGMYI